MRKLIRLLPFAIAAATLLPACNKEDNWDEYKDWRNANNEWYQQQMYKLDSLGQPYYTQLSPAWNPNSGVLIHYLNDRSLTEGNLSPLQTSVVSTRYYLRLYDGTPVDSSYNLTDSIYSDVLANQISGWQVALNDMRVGDSCEIIVPYLQGYGTTGSLKINPYSALHFKIELVDIPFYEVPSN